MLAPYTHPILYQKFKGSKIQTTVKPNKLLFFKTVCRHGFHDGVTACSICESNISMLKSQT